MIRKPVEMTRGMRKRSKYVGIGSQRRARKPARRKVIQRELAKYAKATTMAMTTTQRRPTRRDIGRGCVSICEEPGITDINSPQWQRGFTRNDRTGETEIA